MSQLVRYIAALVLALVLAQPASAQSLIRDADIEHALAQLARPVLSAAGLSSDRVRILLINDDRLNAFVIDNNHIFLHSGLVMRLETAAQLQSVIAHEAAHIANGHIARRMQNLQNAGTVTGLGMALAAAALAGGGGRGAGAVAMGVAGSANRVFMSHTRAEESSADAAGLRYMRAAGIDPRAYIEVLMIFRGQELLPEHRQDPYAQTHPMTRDRMRAVEAQGEAQGSGRYTDDPEAAYWFARARGKLSAFTRAPGWTLKRLGASGHADVALMREAVAAHRTPDARKAIATIDKLVAMRPKDPFVHDLRGQILLESRQAGPAVAAYKRAVDLAPRNALILGGYGRALLAAGQPKAARDVLEQARSRDVLNAGILRDLASAYAQTNAPGMAAVATAERYALMGRFDDAAIHAKRAEALLPRGSPAGLRAQDVLSAAETAQKTRRR